MSPASAPGRVILYVEVPYFYAAVERAREPALRERPILVGGDPRKRGKVQSASPEATLRGVEVGMPMLEALERCPRARVVRTDLRRYREVSTRLRVCLRDEVEALEPLALEGAFLDATASPRQSAAPEETAARLIARVRDELSLPLRVGIAPVKFLARLAASEAGDAGILRIRAGEESDFLRPLPVERLPGVGPKTVRTLAALGAHTIGQLLALDRRELELKLGNHGLRIMEFARGEDDSPIRAAKHAQTLSRESTFEQVQLDSGALWERLQMLSQQLETALRRQGLRARTVALKVRYADQGQMTRRRTLPRGTQGGAEIYRVATSLLERTHAGTRAIRLLGLTLSGLDVEGAEDAQLDLFPDP